MRDAAIEARSEHYLGIDEKPVDDHRDPIAGLYRCGDGRWVRLHTNLPHHRDGTLKLLGCGHDRASVQRALDGWYAYEVEDAAVAAGLVVTATRSFDEWDAHPQGRAVAELPLFSIEKIGDAPPEPLPGGDRPLSGIKVLDLTRVIAGPVCGRTLAAHGADVLLITAAHLPAMEALVIDNGRGKLSAHLDLRDASAREKLAALLRQADIFVQGYRPGAIAAIRLQRRGGGAAAARHRLHLDLRLQPRGPVGEPARLRLAGAERQRPQRCGGQSVRLNEPKPLPAQALDHGTGFLMAFGAMSALKRRAVEGGSWHVRCSLAQTAHWCRGLGRVDGTRLADPKRLDVQDRLYDSNSGFGRLTAVRHSAVMSETPVRWDRPSVPLGSDRPEWPI